MKLTKYIIQFFAVACILSIAWATTIDVKHNYGFMTDKLSVPPDTNPEDTILPFPFNDNSGNPYDDQQDGGLYLNTPSNIKPDVIYNPDNNEYILNNKAGTLDYRTPTYMSFDDYQKYAMD